MCAERLSVEKARSLRPERQCRDVVKRRIGAVREYGSESVAVVGEGWERGDQYAGVSSSWFDYGRDRGSYRG